MDFDGHGYRSIFFIDPSSSSLYQSVFAIWMDRNLRKLSPAVWWPLFCKMDTVWVDEFKVSSRFSQLICIDTGKSSHISRNSPSKSERRDRLIHCHLVLAWGWRYTQYLRTIKGTDISIKKVKFYQGLSQLFEGGCLSTHQRCGSGGSRQKNLEFSWNWKYLYLFDVFDVILCRLIGSLFQI